MKLKPPTEHQEIYTWLALVVLDPEPYKACEKRLKEIRKNVSSAEEFEKFLEFSNELLESLESSKTELLQYLVSLILCMEPSIDKLNDVTLILTLSSYIKPDSLIKLEKFKTKCLKGE